MSAETERLVLPRCENGVGYVVLNRPGHLNAFNLDLATQCLETVGNFSQDSAVRAIVIQGAGRVFSTGGDVKEMLTDVRSGQDPAAYFRAPLAAFHQIALALRAAPKAVVAAVHGAVAGVAFNLMLACDLRIAREGTRFTQAFIKLGLSPDGGGTYFLPRLVGYARACELTMLPTELTAETALAWGLVNQVVPEADFDEQVKETAERLAAGPALGVARTKALLNRTYEHSLSEQMEAERLAQVENADSADFGEGLTAFVEKRPPRFGGQ